MEQDDEVSGSGNSIYYKARIHDPRLGRFLSVDPLTKSFPWYTPYQFAGNKPIWALDLDGKEEWLTTDYWEETISSGTTAIEKYTDDAVKAIEDYSTEAVGDGKITFGLHVDISVGAQIELEFKKVFGATVDLGSMEVLSLDINASLTKYGFDGTFDGSVAGGTADDDYIQFKQELSGSFIGGAGISSETKVTTSGGDDGGIGFEDTKVNLSAGLIGVSATDSYDLTNDNSNVKKTQTTGVKAEGNAALILGGHVSFGLEHEAEVKTQ